MQLKEPMQLKDKIESVKEEIKEQYLSDNTPWVIGYSGGKDSTALLQLIMHALDELPQEQLKKEVHILSNDTLVENPAIVNYLDEQLEAIEKIGKIEKFASLNLSSIN